MDGATGPTGATGPQPPSILDDVRVGPLTFRPCEIYESVNVEILGPDGERLHEVNGGNVTFVVGVREWEAFQAATAAFPLGTFLAGFGATPPR